MGDLTQESWEKKRREYRTALIGVTIFGAAMAALAVSLGFIMDKDRARAGSLERQRDLLETQRDECRTQTSTLADKLSFCTAEAARVAAFAPMCEECPPAPQCPNGEGVCDQKRCEWWQRGLAAELSRCTDYLAGCRNINAGVEPRTPITLGEAYAQQVERARAEVAPIRADWDTKMAEFAVLFEQAKALGMGPRARDWIKNPEAVRLFIEMTVRWADIEQIQYKIDNAIRGVHDRLSNACWSDLNEMQPMDDVMPDWRTYHGLRDQYIRMADTHMFFYICKDEIERQAEEASGP